MVHATCITMMQAPGNYEAMKKSKYHTLQKAASGLHYYTLINERSGQVLHCPHENRNEKVKQILAIIAVVLLVGMYISTLVFTVQKNENAAAWFRASIACTILVPVFYAFFLIARTLRPSKSPLIDAVIFDVGRFCSIFRETYAEKLDLSPEISMPSRKNVMNSKLLSEFDRNNWPYEDIVRDFCRICPAYKKKSMKSSTPLTAASNLFPIQRNGFPN